jgi:hypothetical protein
MIIGIRPVLYTVVKGDILTLIQRIEAQSSDPETITLTVMGLYIYTSRTFLLAVNNGTSYQLL